MAETFGPGLAGRMRNEIGDARPEQASSASASASRASPSFSWRRTSPSRLISEKLCEDQDMACRSTSSRPPNGRTIRTQFRMLQYQARVLIVRAMDPSRALCSVGSVL